MKNKKNIIAVTAKTKYFYPCPKCSKDIQVAIPPRTAVTKDKPYWDGLTTCPNKKCGHMHMKRAYPSHLVEILVFPEDLKPLPKKRNTGVPIYFRKQLVGNSNEPEKTAVNFLKAVKSKKNGKSKR